MAWTSTPVMRHMTTCLCHPRDRFGRRALANAISLFLMSPSWPSLFSVDLPKSSILRMSSVGAATYIPCQHNPGRHRGLANALLACWGE